MLGNESVAIKKGIRDRTKLSFPNFQSMETVTKLFCIPPTALDRTSEYKSPYIHSPLPHSLVASPHLSLIDFLLLVHTKERENIFYKKNVTTVGN